MVEVAVRANAFHLVPMADTDQQCFGAEVEGVTYLGDDVEFRVRVGSARLITRVSDAEVRSAGLGVEPAPGDTIQLRVAPDELIEING
jgi:hypothetical protein